MEQNIATGKALRQLENIARKSKFPLASWILNYSGFNPSNFFTQYQRKNSFSEKELNFIDRTYKRIEYYETASNTFTDKGLRSELLNLMEDVYFLQDEDNNLNMKIREINRGYPVYGRYLTVAKNAIKQISDQGLEKKYSTKLEKLTDKFFSIYNTLKSD